MRQCADQTKIGGEREGKRCLAVAKNVQRILRKMKKRGFGKTPESRYFIESILSEISSKVAFFVHFIYILCGMGYNLLIISRERRI